MNTTKTLLIAAALATTATLGFAQPAAAPAAAKPTAAAPAHAASKPAHAASKPAHANKQHKSDAQHKDGKAKAASAPAAK